MSTPFGQVTQQVAGVARQVTVAVLNSHLNTWYSEDPAEDKWNPVREAQAEHLLAASRESSADLVIVGGDLNSSPQSRVYSKMVAAGLTDRLLDIKVRLLIQSSNLRHYVHEPYISLSKAYRDPPLKKIIVFHLTRLNMLCLRQLLELI